MINTYILGVLSGGVICLLVMAVILWYEQIEGKKRLEGKRKKLKALQAATNRASRENDLILQEMLNGNRDTYAIVEKAAPYLNRPNDYYPDW